MRRALGSSCRRKMTADRPGNFSIQNYVSLATQWSCARAGDAGLSHTLRCPLGHPAAPSPVLPDSHAPGAMHTFPGTSLTIQRAYYLQVSPETFCCCCSLFLLCFKYFRILFKTGWQKTSLLTSSHTPLTDKQLPPRCHTK